jgi:hypothetical protein
MILFIGMLPASNLSMGSRARLERILFPALKCAKGELELLIENIITVQIYILIFTLFSNFTNTL